MKDKILIIGGYGKVGSIISKHLAKLYPKKIIVAGRSLKKAEKLAETLNHNVDPISLNISDSVYHPILENTQMVIMCIDQDDTHFIEQCIEKKIHYIDITANQPLFNKIEPLNNKAKLNNVSIVLSIGLAPGISNLLAQYCRKQLPNSKLVNIFILLGLGEKHGDAAYRWTLENIHSTYKISANNQGQIVKSFTLPKKTKLMGNRIFYTFNFSDQHILSKTLDIPVMTRMALDSKILTAYLAFLRKIGFSIFFNFNIIQSMLIYLFKKLNIGNDDFAVKAVAEGLNDQTYECSVKGKGEGKLTAYVAIATVRYMRDNKPTYGVNHLHQLIKEIPDFLIQLKQYDQTLEIQLS